MKRLLLLCCILTSSLSYAQVPNFLDNLPEWRITLQIDTQYPCVPIHDYTLYTNGDSTIGSFTYKKIYSHGTITYNYFDQPPVGDPNFTCFGVHPFSNQFVTLIRQDSLKLYEYISGNDELMYDFDLQIGDTTLLTSVGLSEGWTVTSIDSILIGSSYSKIFYLNRTPFPGDSTFIIEGVGHEGGLTEGYKNFFENSSTLNCYAQNDTTYFPAFQQACDFDVSVTEVKPSLELTISPNPTKEKIQIDVKGFVGQPFQGRILNSLGQAVIEFNLTSLDNNIDVSSLENGTYFIEIKSNTHFGVTQFLKVR